ncbi:hypothetical protein [Elioraea tepidiphila]|uniref:hypothetical protein n=1 Tax=Elioraea tepidiphila TaxID=457934 RepID=UPI000376A258|nr:hypothetical protein [Elioraea tepidiphila]
MPPALRLAGLAIEAQAAAIRARTCATGRRVVLGAIAAALALFALALLHVAGWLALLPVLGPVGAPLALASADLALAAVLVLVARRRDPAAEAAERARDVALAALGPTLAAPAGLIPLAGLAAELIQGLRRRQSRSHTAGLSRVREDARRE